MRDTLRDTFTYIQLFLSFLFLLLKVFTALGFVESGKKLGCKKLQ
jgi:hypothetical protein